jgi:hypothetical protein
MNKLAVESYVRNLLGQIVAAVVIVSQTSGVPSPAEFSGAEWLLVANALWASLIPVVIRWANKKDPAFGAVAAVVAAEVSKKISKKPSAGTITDASSFAGVTAKKTTKKKSPKK